MELAQPSQMAAEPSLARGKDRRRCGSGIDSLGGIVSNRTMLIADPGIQERVRDITHALIGEGEPLA